MTRCLRRIAPLALVLCSLAAAAPAAAQDSAAAEALFNQGLADMEAGRYEAGCKAIAESHRLEPKLGALFTLATCESRWGRIAAASAHFGEYLAQVEQLPPEQKSRQGDRPKVARQERDRLAPLVPELSLALPPGAPTGTVVKRDGGVVDGAALGASVPVEPGEHVVSTQAPGGSVWETRIQLAQGEKKRVELQVNGAEAAPAGGASGRRTAVYVAGGVGVAGLVLGGITGALTLGRKSIVEKHCGSGIGSSDETACDQIGLDAAESASATGLVSTIGFGVGLAGLGAAAVLYLTEPKQSDATAGATSSRIRAGVLAAGPGGVVLGARGAW
ncbi:hypothetical protein BE21_41555 [Sorangium cellulosum]|uniref:PEGA domain-containing protein n=1 Tax=Sorangium cellulosum TaxID=56 RepID=A0A150TKW6_SORCE|nr:hypothetical protein BE21_41555 [Sorangium cellulosum]